MIEELCKAESDAETRILFIDSTGNECLSNRQMCTIESAAITNPDMTIYVYLHSPDSRNNGTIKKTTRCSKMDDLSEHYTNIHFIRLDLKSLLIGTRLISILVSNNRRQHLERHLSDATRIAALYKYGGIFIDWNAIVLRSLRCLKNALAHQHSEKSSVNVLVFDRGHAFLSTLMNVMKQLFDPEVEGSIGWQAVTSAIRAFCNVGELVNENGQLLTCRENSKLTIPYTAAFNSIASIEKTFLTNESFLEFSLKRLERSFLIDTNGNESSFSTSLRNFLAERFCPICFLNSSKSSDA